MRSRDRTCLTNSGLSAHIAIALIANLARRTSSIFDGSAVRLVPFPLAGEGSERSAPGCGNGLGWHHDTSLAPTLRNSSSSPSLPRGERRDADPAPDERGEQVGRLRRGRPRSGTRRPCRSSARPAPARRVGLDDARGTPPGRRAPRSTRTPSPMTRALTSSILPLTTIRPRSMIATDVQNSDISARMCDEIRTVLPSAARRLEDVLEVDPPLRVDAAGRLVEDQDLRVGDQRLGQHQPLPHPPRQLDDHRRRASPSGRPGSSSRSIAAGRSARGMP